jgi:hypothetical protein
MSDLAAAVRAYGALLDEQLIYGSTPERDAALAQAHHDVLVAQHADGGCAFCVAAEPKEAPSG